MTEHVYTADEIMEDAYAAFGVWADKWMEDHPDEQRGLVDLAIEEYGKEDNDTITTAAK